MNDEKIRVLCVDDHEFLADGLRTRLAMETDLEFAGWLPKADSLRGEVSRVRADVVLLDIDMPGADPFEVLADLKRSVPDVRVVILSAHVKDHFIDTAVDAGAWGYLSKSDSPEMVVDAIRRVVGGEFVFGANVLERCQTGPTGKSLAQKPASRLARLTPRELQILRLLGRGMSRTEIAETIHRSPKTVDNHRASIMDKLGINDRVELARYAIRENLTEL